MRRLVSTIKIFVDDNKEYNGTDVGFHAVGGVSRTDNWMGDTSNIQITLNPSRDLPSLEAFGLNTAPDEESQKKVFASLLAHELGHAVEMIVRDKDHVRSPNRDVLGAEHKAWELANAMTKVDPNVQSVALKTYEQSANEETTLKSLIEMLKDYLKEKNGKTPLQTPAQGY